MPKIFLSHSSHDSAKALAVASWLEEHGWADYFLDLHPQHGLAPGARWQEELKRAADRCEAVIFLVSPAWRDSKWCLAEFLLAKQLGKAIFGVLIEEMSIESLPTEMTATWQLCDLVRGEARSPFVVAADPIVARTELSFASAGLERLRIGLQKAGLDPSTFPWPPPNEPDRAPYRGLKALEPQDAAVFFGREAAIVRGLDALRGIRERGVERMLVVLGASGSGKSSFLRAGLLPRLARNDRAFLPLPVVRPGRAALSGTDGLGASVEGALRARGISRPRAEIRNALRVPQGLRTLLVELLAAVRGDGEDEGEAPTIVLSIDQGEELFSADGGEEARLVLQRLAEVLGGEGENRARGAPTAVAIVSIRSDAYEPLQRAPELEHVRPQLFDLRPLATAEFKAVIEGPAARATAAGRPLEIKPGLTERLLSEAEGADAMPLLAFTLERLFVEYGGDGDLRLDEYDALGGVRGSIEAAVAAAFEDPARAPTIPTDELDRDRLLRAGMIPWLASVDPTSGVAKRRVARRDEIPPEALPILERLVETRLLLRDRRDLAGGTSAEVLEVAHEALLREWPKLTAWLAEEREALEVAEGVARAAADWARSGRSSDWLLHTEGRLRAAEDLLRRADYQRLLAGAASEYLADCRKREDDAHYEREAHLVAIEAEQRRVEAEQAKTATAQRRGRWLLALAALVIVVAAGWVVRQTREVSRQTSLVLATDAARQSDLEQFDSALRLAVLGSTSGALSPASPEAGAELARAAYGSSLVARLEGHEDSVLSAAFSPDGAFVVSASDDHTARVWDARTGKPLVRLEGHEDHVQSAAFSPDGASIVTSSDDGTVRVWDARTGKPLARLDGYQNSVSSAAFSSDGASIVTASDDHTARVWDARTGKPLARLEGHEDKVWSAAFSPDGASIVTASDDHTARVWDARTGKPLVRLEGHEDEVGSAAFSPDGASIVTSSDDGTVRVWDARTGKPLARLEVYERTVRSDAFSPDGASIVTTAADNTARVWDARTGKLLARLEGHEGAVESAVFSPDGASIVTASDDNTARVWDARTGKPLARLEGHEERVRNAAFSPDGAFIVTASFDNTARVWDARTGKPLARRLAGHEDEVWSAAFSPDGASVVTASFDKTARVWDTRSGKPLARLEGHEGAVGSVAFSPDGASIVTGSGDGTARVWDARSGKPIARLEGHESGVPSAAFSPDGASIVTASADNTARVWDARSGKPLARLEGHEDKVMSAAFSPDGASIVTASDDNTARVWDARTGKPLARLEGHEDKVKSAAFSPNGASIVTASDDNTARVWDARTGKPLARLEGHEGGLSNAAYSPDGASIVTASGDNTARVWDARTGKLLARLGGHEGSVFSAAFSPDGASIVTASGDNSARIWDARTGRPIATLEGHEDMIMSAAFSPDGASILTASWDTTARVWDARWQPVPRDQLVARVCGEKLSGARSLTETDERASSIVRGRVGEDVCDPPTAFARALRAFREVTGTTEAAPGP